MSSRPQDEIAVIGLAAELPGGAGAATNLDVDAFFKFLLEKGESYEKIPAERFNMDKLQGRGLGQLVTEKGSFLKNITHFDSIEFGVTNKDAHAMPVATRKLIETTFLALLDSGIDYRGQNVGCFMSGVAHDPVAISGQDESELRGSFAGGIATVANRVSYHLDLRGPSIPTDTACSSSIVATHLAVQALKAGDCDAAVVGGAQLNHRFSDWINYYQGGILSPDGKCKPFDASADGFGRAEGVVSMVLKPLDAAIRDNDKVYATILGTGINNCGSLAPVNAPVAASQMDAMKRAFAMAKRRPQEVDFLELHATGTASGDPTEANWVGEQFKRDDELIIGSLKGNVGHLEITSFLASLCKVVGAFSSGIIAPNVNLTTPNPAIHWEEYKFRVPLEPEPLPCRSPSGRSLVAMTSSGITGSNGHCVVESPPKIEKSVNSFWIPGANIPSLVVAAGLSPRSAAAVAETAGESIAQYSSHDLSRLFGRRVRSLTWRSFAVETGNKLSRFSEPALIPKSAPPLVFVFSGQGPQHFEMGRGLFATSSVFRSTVLELDAVHKKAAGYSLIERYGLYTNEPQVEDELGEVWPIAVTLPSLAILHIALYDTLVAAGVKPDIVLGHSAGETSVLYASGSGSKELAVELAVARGKAMSLLEDRFGTMAAVSSSPEEIEQIIKEVTKELGPGSIEIGCYNTPGSITLSGLASHIDLAVAKATDAGIFARRLRTRVPVHSSMMDICEREYKQLSAEVFAKYSTTAPVVETYSTLNGGLRTEAFTSEYFWDSTRGAVRFTQAMQALTAKHHGATFLEIGPHPVLVSYLGTLAGKESTVACPLRRPKGRDLSVEVVGFLEALGKIVVAGQNCVDFDVLYGGLGEEKEPPLTFPFARKDIPYKSPSLIMTKQNQQRNGPMNYDQLTMNVKSHPGLADHLIKDEPIMPAAGYIEMALESGARKLWDVKFISILGLSSETPTPVNVQLDGSKWSIKSASPGDQYKVYPLKYDRLHATGYMSTEVSDVDGAPALNVSAIKDRLAPVDMKNFYKGLSGFAQYGKLYQRIVACSMGVNAEGQDEFLVQVRANDADLQPEIDAYRIHPAVLDAAVHTAVHPMITGYKRGSRYYLPSKFRSLDVHEALNQRPFPKTIFSHLTLVGATPSALTYNCTIVDESGNPMLTMRGLDVALHGNFVKKVAHRFEVQKLDTEVAVTRAASPAPSTHAKGSPPPVVLEYVRGQEMLLQQQIQPLDALTPHTLWFHARGGFNGDAALGFTRALRKDFAVWSIHIAVFDASWTVSERQNALEQLISIPGCEVEMYVDADGVVRAPRIQEISAPKCEIDFDEDKPWVQQGSAIVHVADPEVPVQHVRVDVTGATQHGAEVWAYTGTVSGCNRRVVGVVTGPVTNTIVAHKGTIVEIPADGAIPDALVHTITGLALGNAIADGDRLCSISVAIEENDSEVAQLCTLLGARVTTISPHLSSSDLRTLSDVRPDVVIARSRQKNNAQLLTDFVSPRGRVLFWQDPEHGIPHLLATDPWAVGDALRTSMQRSILPGNYVEPLKLTTIQPNTKTEYRAPLFSADKAYVLVGGVGSLGVDIAYWMYKNGARYIVLTSRSGRDTLAKAGGLPRRLVAHMETLADLTLRIVACDALSTNDTARLLQSIDRPIGGCMMLSVVLADRPFVAQTEESFETAFKPKTGAFQVFESLVPIDTMDFLVVFSSVSAMFGNAGQTNYASANTALTGLAAGYRRAFTLIVPAITDSFVSNREEEYLMRVDHLLRWGITGADLCEYIGDGIRKLDDGPLGQYVPEFDWNLVHANMGASTLYAHLVTDDGISSEGTSSGAPASLADIVCKTLNIAAEDLSPNVPFTAYGLDSLSAASLSYALAPVLRISQIQLLADITLAQLEERQAANLNADAPSDNTSTETAQIDAAPAIKISEESREEKVKEMWDAVARFTSNWPEVGDAAEIHRAPRKTVFITGTTGSLGAHALARLLREPDVEKVYAFVRKHQGVSALERQREAMTHRGIDASDLVSDKLAFVEGDLAAPALGMQSQDYEVLFNTVTDVAHAAWTIHFGVPLSGFEDDFRGLRALLDLALGPGSRAPANFILAGTGGLFRNLQGSDAPEVIPEDFVREPALAVASGYTESKWVAELIVAGAAEQTPLKPSLVRVTQLTGGLNGAWKEAEWFPGLVATSVAIGCLPNKHDLCAWMDADTAAAVFIDMLDSGKPVLHLQHPHPKALNELLEPLAEALNLPLVTYPEWLARFEAVASQVVRGEIQPSEQLKTGVRLLDVFRTLIRKTKADPEGTFDNRVDMAMSLTVEESKTLMDPKIRQMDAGDVQRWVAYWRSTGFLPSA